MDAHEKELNKLRSKIGRLNRTIKRKNHVIRTIEHHNNRLENDNRAKTSALETFYEKHRIIAQHLQDKGVMKDWTRHELDVLLIYINQLEKYVATAEFANYKMNLASDSMSETTKAWNENKRLREALEQIAEGGYTFLQILEVASQALEGDS